MFVEQAALDNGKTQLGYLLSGYPDPAPLGFSARRAPGLKTFSRLTPPQRMAANLAYLKDLDYAETRIAQLWIASPAKASDSRPDRSRRRGRGQAKATEETAATPQEPSCNLGDSVGARPRAPKHASQDSCFACSEPGADVPPPFDPNCTDKIEPLKLVSLLVSWFYESKSCLTWFTKHSLSKPACTLEAVVPTYGRSLPLCGVGRLADAPALVIECAD